MVIERGILRVQSIQNRGVSFSLAVAAAPVAVCAPCAMGPGHARTSRCRASQIRVRQKKKSRPRLYNPRCRRCHYNSIQVIDGTVVTICSWTHPKKGLVWCLALANGFDVSHLKWGGDETYAEVLFELLAKSPTVLAATGLRLRRGLLCVFRHPNFYPMGADPPGIWNIQSVDLASGVATAAGLPCNPRQAA